MGKDKTVVVKSLDKKIVFFTRFDFKVVTFKLLSFILLFMFGFTVKVFATDRMLTFQDNERKKVLGNFKEKQVHWSIAICRGCSNQNVVIKNKIGKVLSQGVEGSFITNEPVNVEIEGKFNFDWRMDIRFSSVADKPKESISSSNTNNSVVSNGGCCPNLSPIERLLKEIKDSINKIYDFLVSTKSIDNGVNDLKKSIDKLNDKFTPKKETINNLKSIGKGSGTSDLETDLNIEFAKGVKFNTFDLSAVEKHLGVIRNLMSAIIWIEFSVFLIRVVVPKFKV